MVNPLPPHYSCPSCHYYEEVKIDVPYNIRGFDLKHIHGYDCLDAVCPICGNEMKPNGNDINPEILMGKDLTREPQIALNTPPSIRRSIVDHIKDKYKNYQIIRAGVSVRTHAGDIRKSVHPGGIYIIPKDVVIENHTALRTCDSDDEFQMSITDKAFHEVDKHFFRYDILTLPILDVIHDLAAKTNIMWKDIALNDNGIIDVFREERFSFIPNLSKYLMENKVEQDIFSCYTPVRFSDIVKIRGLLSGVNTWINNGEKWVRFGISPRNLITCRDDVYQELLDLGIDRNKSWDAMNSIIHDKDNKEKGLETVCAAGASFLFIDSCCIIKYLYPKSHLVEYAILDCIMAYYKSYHPFQYKNVISKYLRDYCNDR